MLDADAMMRGVERACAAPAGPGAPGTWQVAQAVLPIPVPPPPVLPGWPAGSGGQPLGENIGEKSDRMRRRLSYQADEVAQGRVAGALRRAVSIDDYPLDVDDPPAPLWRPPAAQGPARVDPGLGGQMQRAMQERMGAGGDSQTYDGLYGPTRIGLGGPLALPGGAAPGQPGQGAAAMSGLPPGWQGATGLPGLVPPPQLAPLPGLEPLPDDLRRRLGEPESFPIDPQAGRGSTVSTPTPEPVRGSNVLPGRTIQPAGPQIAAMARPKPNKAELKKQTAIIKAKGLPTRGRFPYVPPKAWTSSQPLPRGPSKGYLDIDGAEWMPPRGQILGPRHWDVQMPGGGHRNVTTEGEIDHG